MGAPSIHDPFFRSILREFLVFLGTPDIRGTGEFMIFRTSVRLALLLATWMTLWGLPPPLLAQEKERISVLDLEMAGGTEIQAAALTNRLRADLLRSGKVTLRDRSQLGAILEEQDIQ